MDPLIQAAAEMAPAEGAPAGKRSRVGSEGSGETGG